MYAVCYTPSDDAEIRVYATATTFKAAQRKFKSMCDHRDNKEPGLAPLKSSFSRCFILGPKGPVNYHGARGQVMFRALCIGTADRPTLDEFETQEAS